MAFQITLTEDARRQFRALSARQQRIIEKNIVEKLTHGPTIESKAIKRLLRNAVAEFELRIGDYRVLYNVEPTEVLVIAIGEKRGNTLFIEGGEFHEHEGDESQ